MNYASSRIPMLLAATVSGFKRSTEHTKLSVTRVGEKCTYAMAMHGMYLILALGQGHPRLMQK